MAIGNTFGATALSSYGGFWLSFAIILTPGGFEIESILAENGMAPFLNSFGLYLMGWFIFTTLLLICTLRSTIAFFSLFFTLDIAFLLLGIGYLQNDGMHPHSGCIKAGGYFGLFAAFLAWYNALAGIADNSNRSVTLVHVLFASSPVTNTSQLLCHPGRTLPVEREGPREAQGRQRRIRINDDSSHVYHEKYPVFVLFRASMFIHEDPMRFYDFGYSERGVMRCHLYCRAPWPGCCTNHQRSAMPLTYFYNFTAFNSS
jgi:succinate-acetate transporter protein